MRSWQSSTLADIYNAYRGHGKHAGEDRGMEREDLREQTVPSDPEYTRCSERLKS